MKYKSFSEWWAFNREHYEGKPLTEDIAKEIFKEAIDAPLRSMRYDYDVIRKADCLAVLESYLTQ